MTVKKCRLVNNESEGSLRKENNKLEIDLEDDLKDDLEDALKNDLLDKLKD